MQTYPIILNYGQTSQSQMVAADLFVYESANVKPRINRLTYTADFTNIAWSKSNGGVGSVPTVTPNYGLAPDGTKTATRLQMALNGGTASTDISRMCQQVAVAIGTDVTETIWIKTADGSTKTIIYRDDYGLSSLGQTITVTGQWQMLRMSGTVSGNPYCNAVGLWLRGGQGTSDSVDLLIAWPQLEDGLSPTPYIPSPGAAATEGMAGDTRIKVKADNGSEITLKPGQRVRMTQAANVWTITSYDGMTPMTVNAVIGSGEFDDANTLNTFKFDSTSAAISTNVINPVSITGEVEVKNDTGNPLSVQQSAVPVTGAWSNSGANGTTLQTLVAPATNTRGLIVQNLQIVCMTTAFYDGFFYASDGTTTMHLLYAPGNAANQTLLSTLASPVVLPPGFGLYFNTNTTSLVQQFKSALWTVK